MSKKQMSRRVFLAGIAKTTAAAFLANLLKFVPEAQGTLAQPASPSTPEPGTVSPLPAHRVDELATQATKREDNKRLREFLKSKGFAEAPQSILGQQMKATTEDGGTLIADVIWGWYLNEEDQQKAILAHVSATYEHVGQKTLSHTQIPVVIISNDTAYVVDGDQVSAHKNPPDSLKLLTQYLSSGFPDGNSLDTVHHKRAKVTLGHHPCCSFFYNWAGALAATTAMLVCCAVPVTAPVCCPAAVAFAATAVSYSAGFVACCSANPGCYCFSH